MSRSRLIAVVISGLAAFVFASWFGLWLRSTPAQLASADYTLNYVAAMQWRDGQGASLYDTTRQQQQGSALGLTGAQFNGNHFVDPPLAAAVAAPFSLLPLSASFRVWSLLQLALTVVAVAIVIRRAPWPRGLPNAARAMAGAVAVAGAGTAVLFLEGQWDGFSAVGLALAYASWRRGHRATGGALLAAGMLLAKPHLALVLVAWLLGRRDRRMLAGAAAGTLALVAATLLLVGPASIGAALRAPGLSMGATPAAMLVSFLGLAASWLGDVPAAYALAAMATVMALGAGVLLGAWTRRRPQTLELSLGAATVLSLLAAPHLLVQDLAILSVPLVWGLARAASADGVRSWPGARTLALLAGWVVLDLAARADFANYTPAPPGRLVPVVLIGGLVLVGLTALRRRRDAGAAVAAAGSIALR